MVGPVSDEFGFGVGSYAMPDAARLVGVPRQRAMRWVRGYSFRLSDGTARRMPPVVRHRAPPRMVEGRVRLSFLDLIELRLADLVLEQGIRLHVLRRCLENAAEVLGTNYPLASQRLYHDGRQILVQLKRRNVDTPQTLVELLTMQGAFADVVRPFLSQIRYDERDIAATWWPLGTDRRVVIDPRRAFGSPIESTHSVQTSILAASFEANARDVDRVAWWYGVPRESVLDSVDFERRRAA